MSELITPYKDVSTDKKEQVSNMFDNIARKYDFLNHFLSMGIDILWRKKAIRKLKKYLANHFSDEKEWQLLDVATGTGDLAIEAAGKIPQAKITGVDISKNMLSVGRGKISAKYLENRIELQVGDSENLSYKDNNFHGITVGFGVRNFEHLEKGLQEMYRVLKQDGMLVILEFSNPKVFPFKQLFRFYFMNVLPFIGRVVSKDKRAYTYLPESVLSFPNGKKFLEILKKTGFQQTKARALTFGICTLYTGTK